MSAAQNSWPLLFLLLVFLLTGTQILVSHAQSLGNHRPTGLGLYTVYLTAALLVWTIYALQLFTDSVPRDLPGIAAVINNYVLFTVIGQRSEIVTGRVTLAVICTLAILAGFFLPSATAILVQDLTLATLFVAVGVLAMARCIHKRSVGDGIIILGALIMIAGMPLSHLELQSAGVSIYSTELSFGLQSITHVLVMTGFLASLLTDYENRLGQLAVNDALTGLLNRRGLRDALRLPLALANREKSPVAAIALELDHYPSIVEGFGNESADQLVIELAELLRDIIRASDVPARLEASDFMIILPHHNLTAARAVAERIRDRMLATPPSIANQQGIPVTVSMGIADNTGKADLEALCEAASRALTLARNEGGNRIASLAGAPLHVSSSGQDS